MLPPRIIRMPSFVISYRLYATPPYKSANSPNLYFFNSISIVPYVSRKLVVAIYASLSEASWFIISSSNWRLSANWDARVCL